MRERQIDHFANAVKYETNTQVLRDRRISLLGFDPAEALPSPSLKSEIARLGEKR